MLEVKDLTVRYDGALALDNVSLQVRDREFVSVIGPNGAGKTTLLRALSGLLREVRVTEGGKAQVSGPITFDGTRIDKLKPWEIAKMGIIHCPEREKIFPEMTVFENLQTGTYLRKNKDEIKKDLERILQLFPFIKERKSQTASTLSGGERQMLAIAMSLMMKPKLLLLDEPSLGLAPILKQKVFKHIELIRTYGVTVLLVEQDVSLALDLADRIYVLAHGRIAVEGTREELIKNRSIIGAYLGVLT
jgi:branched-chain amino acid transport system ATP-binding protein